KPSRSDVLRSFIAQGVRGKFTPASQEAEMFPLSARLNIFFQLIKLLLRKTEFNTLVFHVHGGLTWFRLSGFITFVYVHKL
ncbi:hypothetical protein ACSLOF_26450, partial [Escherichia coli]